MQILMFKICRQDWNYSAVINVIKPKTTPGKLAATIGKSRFGFFISPYATQSVQLIAATSGWSQLPFAPLKLFPICGIYETYIAIAVALATHPKTVKNFESILSPIKLRSKEERNLSGKL